MPGLFPNYPAAQGEEHWAAKLTDAAVLHARKLYWQRDLCIRCIAILLEIRYTTAYDAIHGRTWRHLPMPKDERASKAGKYRREVRSAR